MKLDQNVPCSGSTATKLRSAVLLVAGALFGLAGQAAAAPLSGEFTGHARLMAAGGVDIALAFQIATASHESCGCRGTSGVTRTATASSVSIGPSGSIATAATSATSAYGTKTASTAATLQTATVTKLNLLGGLITADALTASAGVSATATRLAASDAGTTIANLVIAGKTIDPNTPDNTEVILPGIGSVVVRATEQGVGKLKAHLLVDMLLVKVGQANSLGLPVGAKLAVAQAYAAYSRAQPAAALGGFASAAVVRGNAGPLVDETAGRGSAVGIPDCDGTGGATLTRSVSDINLPGFLTVDAATTTAFGGTIGSGIGSKTSATLTNVSFLGGLVRATSLTSVAQESRSGSVSTASTAGSGFNGLTIGGLPVNLNTPPNTQLTLPSLGSVIVNEQIQLGPNTVEVNALHVVVGKLNLFGLPVGTEIVLGHAIAQATKF